MHLTVLRTMESGAFGEPFALFKQVLEPKRPASDVFVSKPNEQAERLESNVWGLRVGAVWRARKGQGVRSWKFSAKSYCAKTR